MASVSKGMFGGHLPWAMIGLGAIVGAVTIALDEFLKHRGSSFRVPGSLRAIGIYLPLELMVPIFLGSLLSYFVEKKHGITKADESTREHAHRPGTLFSAGLITGEALTGILIAIPIVVSGRADVLALPESLHFGQVVGLGVLFVVGWLLYQSGAKPKM